MSENSIRFIDGRSLRNEMEACWEGDIDDGEERPPKFVCCACKESKPFDQVSLEVQIEGRTRRGLCRDCRISFEPPSMARRLFG